MTATGVTSCIPCPGHSEDFAVCHEVTLPYWLTDDDALTRLEHIMCDTTGNQITIHKGPVLDFSGRQWAVTVP